MLACSALKRAYREILSADGGVTVVYLKADPDLIRARLQARRDHYMPPGLIDSQFRDLEEPRRSIVIDAALPPEQAVAAIRSQIAT